MLPTAHSGSAALGWICDLAVFPSSQRGFSDYSRHSGGLPGSWQDPVFQRESCIPFFSWLSLLEDGLVLMVSGESQKNSEHHGEYFHLAPLLACEHTYPPKAHCLSPQVPSSPCVWRQAVNRWKSSRYHGTANIAELDVKVTHEAHCPLHLAMMLHFTRITTSEVWHNSQGRSIQPSCVHFSVEGTDIKMT